MSVDALNCPNCGAGVAGDSSQCPFCKTRLKTMACPTCFEQMFVGSEFCDHCGAKAVRVTSGEEESSGDCPRCKIGLDRLKIGDVVLDECRKCNGLWADTETFHTISADRERQSAVLGFAGTRRQNAEPLASISYVPCPICKQLMNRSNFARASGVIIDTCKQHGVWFDADELPKIIEFIQKGGMELARQKERIEIRDEVDRLRDMQRKEGTYDSRFGEGNSKDFDHTDGIYHFISRILS
jgi:Zn-finger nucleic acid-binding protein